MYLSINIQQIIYWAPAAKLLQSRPTLCDPIDSSPPGSPVPGILQARTLEWVAISFSNAWKWKVKMKSLLATPWTAAYQAPLSMGFSRQEYWSGVPLPSPKIYLKTNKIYFYSCRARPQAKSVLSSWGAPNPTLHHFFFFGYQCSAVLILPLWRLISPLAMLLHCQLLRLVLT